MDLPDPTAECAHGALAACADDLAVDPVRRRLLAKTAAVGMSLALGNAMRPRRAWADHTVAPTDVFVLIFLRGGLDALNTVVPIGTDHPDYLALRPGIAVRDAEDLGDGVFGLHPALKPLLGTSKAWDPVLRTGDLALIHMTGTAQNTRSHFDAQDITDRGVARKADADKDGWLGRHLVCRSTHGPVVRSLGIAAATPLSLYRKGLTPILMRRAADFGLAQHSSTNNVSALRTLHSGFTHSMTAHAGAALDAYAKVSGLGTYTPPTGVEYKTDELSQALKLVAQMIRKDAAGGTAPPFGLEAVAIDHGPYDLHRNMGTSAAGELRNRLSEVGNALASFRQDLATTEGLPPTRLWDRVTVCVVSEFGRRIPENGAGGTEHGYGGVAMVLGGKIKGASGSGSNVWLRGGWPRLADNATGELDVRTDIRDVFHEIASVRLGASSAALASTVFPGFTPSPLGFAIPG